MDFAIALTSENCWSKEKTGKTPSLISEILVFVAIGYVKYEFSLRQEYFYSENLKLAA
jgi:hypothetical protein